jgi:ABC-2 type transport system ATP-binding protein
LLSQVQEICDRVGILHKGTLIREGRLDELISIENQTEIILENASPEVLARIRSMLDESGARVLAERKPQTTLENFFLEVTGAQKD